MHLKNKKIKVVAIVILIALNVLAFYFINKGIETEKLIRQTQDAGLVAKMQQEQLLNDVLPSLVFTLNIALVLLLVILGIRSLIKKRKTA
ncbi:hypothetical protein MVI27_09425 [Chryseobacterium salipaludis]|uniref:hypothetical protein n=1 Tax=Chryseobacterium TaxID=59732 RepID=UPI001FF4B7B5|nr:MULTISPECIES: hypothetical protein [Chryseobacterium]MCJ8498480.1 hypothetical protein [Chryseobacterium salipaludis]MCX3297195.1 hypothetical protein [Planobacterium sp. JC490]